jgi:hypothetical protein
MRRLDAFAVVLSLAVSFRRLLMPAGRLAC